MENISYTKIIVKEILEITPELLMDKRPEMQIKIALNKNQLTNFFLECLDDFTIEEINELFMQDGRFKIQRIKDKI